MIYKKSLYVYNVYNDVGDLLLYNTRNSKIIKIGQKDTVLYNELIKNDEIIVNDVNKSTWLQKIIEDEFIIPNLFDEVKWCKLKHNEVVYGSKELDVVLIPTNMCNFKCTYCFQSHEENYMDENTEERVVRFLKKKIPKCQMLRVALFGGEPLLCADQLIRILSAADDTCRKNRIPMIGEISTNGYLLTPELFMQLLKLRIYDFQVCIDGPKEFHNKTRPHAYDADSYSVIMKNLKEIKKTVKSKNYSFTIRINLTPQVEPYLDGFLQELAIDFKNDPCFHVAIQCVRNWGGNSITCDQIVDEEPSRYRHWYSRISELGLQGASALHFNPFTYCTAYRKNGYIIDYDGSILKCTHSLQDENKVGYIDTKGNEVINDWKLSNWFVSDIHSNSADHCEKCVLYPFCMEGYCPYAKNILKKKSCNFDITVSMLREKLLELDERNKIQQL